MKPTIFKVNFNETKLNELLEKYCYDEDDFKNGLSYKTSSIAFVLDRGKVSVINFQKLLECMYKIHATTFNAFNKVSELSSCDDNNTKLKNELIPAMDEIFDAINETFDIAENNKYKSIKWL